ncbi:DoxX family protein [Nocardia alba]|uniref:Putative membrane protein YphA (DoxX/SURF4 family) n=1 Tax=Nocardia alba TaxID=225051 RepID=A0A4V2PC44_9NOCA|nr:DoxX family protein [Nocardia alba]TCJ99835.1 putative membrane protein YphA (DoxX/SURF4 family) [Nocardia alba]
MPIKPVRRIARALLGTTFVAAGVNGLMNQKPRAAAANALAEKGRSGLPESLAARVPDDPSQFVRVNSAAQVLGGLLLASGRAPRPAAFVLAATVVPGTVTEQDFWAENDPDRRAAKRVGFLKDLGLLGGLLIAASDTEGKPSLGWRARKALSREESRLAAAKVRGAQLAEVAHEQGTHLAEVANERGSALAEIARERGPQLADVVRSRSAQLVEVAKDRGPEVAEAVRSRGAQLADVAKDRGPEVAEAARTRGAQLVEVAKDRGPEVAEAVRSRGAQLADVAKEKGPELAEAARERGTYLVDTARERSADLAAAAREREEAVVAPARRWSRR